MNVCSTWRTIKAVADPGLRENATIALKLMLQLAPRWGWQIACCVVALSLITSLVAVPRATVSAELTEAAVCDDGGAYQADLGLDYPGAFPAIEAQPASSSKGYEFRSEPRRSTPDPGSYPDGRHCLEVSARTAPSTLVEPGGASASVRCDRCRPTARAPPAGATL
jgi:hypothetical protein